MALRARAQAMSYLAWPRTRAMQGRKYEIHVRSPSGLVCWKPRRDDGTVRQRNGSNVGYTRIRLDRLDIRILFLNDGRSERGDLLCSKHWTVLALLYRSARNDAPIT